MASYTKLTLGSRGDEVKRLQTRLNAHGANLAVDGVFGSLTLDAVKKYQKSRGLAADGVVGDLTWGRLLEGTAAETPAVTASAAASSGGYRRTGVSDETARALADFEKGYTPGQTVTDAEKAHLVVGASRSRANDVIGGAAIPERVLLVDDVVDSRWTLTVCGFRLMENGCREVYPFALADSSQKEA